MAEQLNTPNVPETPVEIETNPLANALAQPIENITSTGSPELQMNAQMVDSVVSDIQNKARQQQSDLYRNYSIDKSTNNPLDSLRDNRIKFEDYSIDVRDTHVRLNSGELQPIYDSYMPNVDNNERLARTQSTMDKWTNGTAKFITGTGSAIAGGTIGTVYGIFDAVAEGSFQNVFDNDFTRYMDDLNTKMRYELPNYYTKQEQEGNLFQQATTANFWADKVLGAAAFTVGAIVSEGIWAAATGGASLGVRAARIASNMGKVGKWGKAFLKTDDVAKGVSTYKGWLKKPLYNAYKKTRALNKEAAIMASKTAQGLNTARFLATSSGYEAGVEALHYKKEAEENFYRDFQNKNGRQPTGEEIAEFEEGLENSANAVFAGNMAILAPSNAVMFGSLFNISSPLKGLTKGVNKTLFGIGTEKIVSDAGKVTYKGLQATKKQKFFSGLFSATKPIATESLWEEGGQSVVSKTAGHWMESTYDPKYNGTTIDLMEAMGESMRETYTTKEGWVELGIGAIIGGGSSVIQGRGKFQELKDIQEQRKFQEDVVAKGKNTFGEDILARRISMNAKIQAAVEREKSGQAKGNIVESELGNQDKLLSEIEFMHSIGEDPSTLLEKYKIAFENMTEEQWEEAGIDDVDSFKDSVLGSYQSLLERYDTNIEYAKAVFGVTDLKGNLGKNEQYAQTLAYVVTTGEKSAEIMSETLNKITEVAGSEFTKAIKIANALEVAGTEVKERLFKTNNRINQLTTIQQDLIERLKVLQSAPKETEGDRTGGKELAEVNTRLLNVQSELETLTQKRSDIASELHDTRGLAAGIGSRKNVADMDSNPDFFMGEDLANIDTKLEEIDTKINSFKNANPKLFRELVGLTEAYNQAKDSFMNYQNTAIAMASGEVKIKAKKVNGLLGKIFNSEEETDFTKDYLADLAKISLVRNSTEESAYATETVTDAETKEPITEERVESIANKLRDKELLSKRELKLLEENREVVEKALARIIKERGNKPVATPTEEQATPKTEAEQLRERLEDSLSKEYYPLGYIGENYEEVVKNKPSKKDVERYRELLQKTDKTTEEQEEFLELEAKLQNWRLMDSAVHGDQSLADIVNLIEQLETEVESEQVMEEQTMEEVSKIVDEALATDTTVVYELTQNTTGNATAKRQFDNTLKLSHIKTQTILDRLGGTFEIIVGGKVLKGTDALKELANLEKGHVVRISPKDSTTAIDFKILEGNALEVVEKDFIQNQDKLNLYIVNNISLNWSYSDIYEKVGDKFEVKKSDIIDDDIQGDSYTLSVGDEVEFYYDNEDPWNVELKERLDKGEIDEEYYRDQIKVYVSIGGKNFQTLKGIREGFSNDGMLAIRDKAVEVSKEGNSGVFGKTTVTQVMLGSPKFELDPNLEIVEQEFTDRAKGQVLATGYILDNVFVLSDKTLEVKTNQSFVGKTSKENAGVRIPVVVVKKGNHIIAYPVTLKPKADPQGFRFDAIMNNTTLNNNEKVKEINDLLIEQGFTPSEYGLTTLSETDKLDRVRTDLETKTVRVKTDDFSQSSYDKKNLSGDASIKIDLEDLPNSVSSPKLRIDLEGFTLYGTIEAKHESRTDIEEALNDFAIEVDRLIHRQGLYVDSNGDAVENRFTEVFTYDDEVYRAPKKHTDKMHNVRLLREAFEVGVPKGFKDILGADKVKEIKRMFAQIEFLRKQIDTRANKAVKNKQSEITCNG